MSTWDRPPRRGRAAPPRARAVEESKPMAYTCFHRCTRREQRVSIIEVGVGVDRHRGDLVGAVEGRLVEGLDVDQLVGELVVARRDQVLRQGVEHERIVGRVSIRDIFKRIAVPSSYLRLVDAIGDETNRLDMSEKRILESVGQHVEHYVLDSIPCVSPASSLVKALAIMEAYNTQYIFLIEEGKYMGIVTRMVIARRLLDWLDEVDRGESLPSN